jgi:hypothetical protein
MRQLSPDDVAVQLRTGVCALRPPHLEAGRAEGVTWSAATYYDGVEALQYGPNIC